MAKLAELVRMTVTGTPGTGTITLNAASTGYRTFATAGISSGTTVSYSISDGTSWEVGKGVYTTAGTTLGRGLVASSTGSLLSLTSAAIVSITDIAADHLPDPTGIGVQGLCVPVLLSDGTVTWARTSTYRFENWSDKYVGNDHHSTGTGAAYNQDFGPDGWGYTLTGSGVGAKTSFRGTGVTDGATARNKPLMAKSGIECILRCPTIPDGTDTAIIKFGYTDQYTYAGQGNAGIYFVLDRAAYSGSNPGNLRAVVRSGGTDTATDTGVTLANDTAYTLRIWLESASSIKFYINETQVANPTTGIPAFTTAGIPPTIYFEKTVGTGVRSAAFSNILWFKEI